MPLDYIEFSKKIKQKYPQYKNVDDMTLAQKMVEKYPEYKNQVVFKEVKKKSFTGLPSQPQRKGTTSATVKTTTQKPSVSSGGKKTNKNVQMFTGFPGKEGKQYALDMSSGIPAWKEYSSSDVVNGKTVDKFEKVITDPNRVNQLNKYFKQNASTSNLEKIRTGLPTKEENQYRVKGDNWERLTEDSNQWEQVNDENAINYLNKYYGESVKVKPKTLKDPEPKVNTTIINTDLISKNEEEVVPTLQRNFGKYGFTFTESGLGTDYVKVTSRDGVTKEFSLDERNPEEALRLKSFIEGNKVATRSAESQRILDLTREATRSDLGIEYRRQKSKELKDYRNSNQFVTDLKNMNFNEVESNINAIKKSYIFRKDKEGLEKFYNSPAYKIYRDKKNENTKSKSDKIDALYYELNQAKTADQRQIVKSKIDTYMSDQFINKQTDNYSIQLSDAKNSAKKLQAAARQYEMDLQEFNSRVESGNISQEEYESSLVSFERRAEYIDSRRSELNQENTRLVSDMKKLETVAGKYIINKEKTGSFGGMMINSTLNGLSKIFEPAVEAVVPFVSDFEVLAIDPDKKRMLKNEKGYTDEQIENYVINESVKNAKQGLRKGLIEAFGSTGTTTEYMQSKDRGFIEKALVGVAESLPAMFTPGGAAARFSTLAAQAYSSIEDEMLNDKDFETSTALERSVVAVPYAMGMGALENLGVSVMLSKNPIAKSLITRSIVGAVGKVGGDATREVFEKVLSKEIKSNMAKFGIRVIGGTLAEAETGALQSLVLDIGWKGVANKIANAYDGKLAQELTDGEYFDTPDSFKEGAMQVLEDAAAEAIGGFVMTTVGTSAQGLINGRLSLYDEKDAEFLKSMTTDPEIKKMFIAKLKTDLLNGKITKSEAESQLQAVNEVSGIFNSTPENITGKDLNDSVQLIIERKALEKEIEGKDENLVAAQKARIAEINNQLKTISENAVQKQAAGEVPVQPGTEISGEMAQGEPQAEPQVTAEESKKEVDSYIANRFRNLKIEPVVGPLLEKMNNAEYIDDADVDNALEVIFAELDDIDNSEYSDDVKKNVKDSLLSLAENLDNYEFRTKDKTVTVAQKRAADSTRENVRKVKVEEFFSGAKATYNGEEVEFDTTDGTVKAKRPNGETIVFDTPSMTVKEDGIVIGEDGNVSTVTMVDRFGSEFTFDGDIALDLAIKDRQNKIGEIPAPVFEVVMEEMTVKEPYIKESKTESAPAQAVETQAAPAEETTKNKTAATETGTKVVGDKIVEEEQTTEPTAPQSEVEALGKLLEGTDVEIDQQIEEINVPADKNKILKSVAKAAKSISKILPNVKFIVHETDDSYRKATGEEGRSQSSRGTYMPATAAGPATIHINLTNANNRTVAHEVFHAILLDRVSSDKQAAAVTRRMISAISKNLANNSDLKKYLDNFAANYDQNIQNEEKLAELVGILAENYINQPPTIKDIIKRWLNKIAQFVGMKPITSETEVMDLLDTIARRVTAGKKIRERKVAKVIGEKEQPSVASMNKRFQADFKDPKTGVEFVFDKNSDKFKKLEDDGYITRDKSIRDFNGSIMFLHQPDGAFSGMIYKNGELLVEGKGGVFYPIKFHEDGYFWASTDSAATKMAKDLNKVYEENGGKIFMALTTAPEEKLLSSTTAANAVMEIFMSKAFDRGFSISRDDVKKSLLDAAAYSEIKKTLVTDADGNPILDSKGQKQYKNKRVGLSLNLKKGGTIDDIKSDIATKLNPSESSFADRKLFAQRLISNIAGVVKKNPKATEQFNLFFKESIKNEQFKGTREKGKDYLKISSANLKQAISNMLTEPMLKGNKNAGEVYAILEIGSKVKPVESNKHESYPKAIQVDGDSKTTLHILTDRILWSSIFEDFKTGKIVTSKREKKIYPTSGVSVRGLRLNTSNIEEGVTQRKQLIGKNANLSQNVRDNLQVARDMEVADKSVKDIRIATGWERGADNKWRYEIDDNILILKSRLLDQLNNIEKPKTYGELSRIDINKIINNELIKLYPELSNTEIVINPTISYGEGYYIPSLNQIHISNNNVYLNNTASVLLHEIQHVIQNIEGFSIGSDINKVTDSVGEKLINEIESGDDAIVYNKLQSIISKMQEDPLNRKKLESGMSKIQTLLDNYSNKKYGKKVNAYAFDVYRRYAGEVEARNVEKRMNMTPEERRQTTLQETEDVSREDQLIFFEGVKSARKQLPDLLDRKQQQSASSIVSVARKNGFSEAAIKQYLESKGFSANEITSAMTVNDTIDINEIFERSKKALREKKSRNTFMKALRFVWNKFIDRQSDIKRLINGIKTAPSAKAFNLLVTRAGAKGFANYRYKEAEDKIYKKLKEKDIDTLDKMIYLRRIIAINENRAERGMEAYRGIEGFSEAEAKRDLEQMKEDLGIDKYNDMMKRADEYFKVFAQSLKNLYESGRLTEEVYNNLKDIEYSPIATIKYIIGDDLSLDEIDRQAEIYGITRKDIATLTDKNENEIIMDSRWLLMMNLMSIEARAWENRMLNSFADAVESANEDQKKALSEFVVMPKSDEKVPAGFVTVNYFKDGKAKRMFVKADYAVQLLDIKTRQSGLEAIGKLSGTQILRFFATGGNPLFIIGNTAVDFANIAFFSNTYSNIKFIAAPRLAYDFLKNFLRKIINTKKYNAAKKEFMEHGGGMDFMSSDGLRVLKNLRPGYKITSAAQSVLVKYANAMSYLGETSEFAFRIAVYEKTKENLVKDYKKENEGKEPKGEDLENIMFQAARDARQTVDFSQGGSWAKSLDTVMPYLNASLQGFRRPLDYAKQSPIGFAFSVVQASLMSGSIAAMSLATLMSSFGDDDDEDEKKAKAIDALNSISEYEKSNYHIVFTGKKNKDGEYEYRRFKKLPVLSMATTLAEQIVYEYLLSNDKKPYAFDKKSMYMAIEKSIPFTPSDIMSRNPLASAILTYHFEKDTFTGEEIFRQPRDKKIDPTAEGLYDDKVEGFYKEIAPALGLSPIRSKAFVEKIITSENTNPTIAIFNAALNGIFDKKTGLGEEFSNAIDRVFESADKKLTRYTNKDIIMYNEMDKAEAEEMRIETDIYKKEQEMYSKIKKVYEEGKTLTNGDVIDMVDERFDRRDRRKYVEKYVTYIRNMNVDRSVLDILYEDTPEVQALKIYNKYGSTLDSEEMSEIMETVRTSRKRISPKAMKVYRDKYKRGN